MLLLFTSNTQIERVEPVLPNLNVKDSLLGTDVSVSGLDGWEDDYIQILKLSHAPLELESQEQLSVGSESSKYWTKRISKIIASFEFTVAEASCTFRVVYYDKNDVPIIGPSVEVTASSYSTSGSDYYMAPMEVLENYGAKQIAFYLETISAGSVLLKATGV